MRVLLLISLLCLQVIGVGCNQQEREAQTGQEQEASEKQNAKIAHQHFVKFHELLPNDVEGAREELDAFAARAFHGHPRTEEWKELFFRLSREQKGTLPEHIQYLELKKQMLKDIDATRHAKEIEQLEKALKQLIPIRKLYEHQGILETEKLPFNMGPAD